MGGEKVRLRWKPKSKKGSPPRGRGKGGAGVLILGQIGITPAWAGKRLLELRRKTGVRDHPRVGGEKHLSGTTDNRPQGSPPRRRGKVDVLPEVHALVGITPAWAGKRARRPSWSYGGGDHPRMGGEKVSSFALAFDHRGSPPHGRGKVVLRQVAGAPAGITPAWAGKRWGRCADTGADRDHPRMGGEKITRIAPKNWGSGSPPRRRGKASVWHYR